MIIKNDNVPFPMAYLIETRNNNVGHLFQLPNFKTSTDGVIVYMELADDLDETLAKVESAEGKIIYVQNTYYTR